MSKKYDYTGKTTALVTGYQAHQIVALKDIPKHGVRAGDLGGWIQHERNLTHLDDCWVGEGCVVHGSAKIRSHALVAGLSEIGGSTLVMGNARVIDVRLTGSCRVGGEARVIGPIDGDKNKYIYDVDIFGTCTKQPISILGLGLDVFILDTEMTVGVMHMTLREWELRQPDSLGVEDEVLVKFWSEYRGLILSLARKSGRL